MEPQAAPNTFAVILDALEVPSGVERFSMFLTGLLAKDILIKYPTDINKISELLAIANNAVKDNLITAPQRRRIIETLAK